MNKSMSVLIVSVISGMVFGLGLSVSQMTDPTKVIGFLDIFGAWDPSLLLTMLGALSVSFVGYRYILRRKPIFSTDFDLPTSSAIDAPLIVGAITFGVGWGLAGYCPGPVVAGLGSGRSEPIIFIGAMLAGTYAASLWQKYGNKKAMYS